MVLRGIGRLDMGLATVGGVGLVLLAIFLDRLTQAIGERSDTNNTLHWYETGPVGFVVRLYRKNKNNYKAVAQSQPSIEQK